MPRYTLLANERNIGAAQEATDMWLAALVDEKAGGAAGSGVIGYLLLGEAQRIVDRLNAVDTVLDVLAAERV